MTRRRVVIMLLLSLFLESAWGSEVLTIGNYDAPVDFSGKEIVRIMKGDSPAYRDPLLDDGGWSLISLPSSWDSLFPRWDGICWYRMKVQFTAGIPANSLGISLGIISDVDEVYFNGRLIGMSGEFPPRRVSAYDKKRIYEIPPGLIAPGGVNVIAMRVQGLFPGEYGPSRGDFRIGYMKDLQRDFIRSELFDALFIIIYFIVGVYFALIFTRSRFDREYLFFALLAIFSALYLFFRTQIKYLVFSDFYLMKKTEYLVLMIIPVLLMEYAASFSRRRTAWLHYLFYAVTSIFLGLVIFTSDPLFWNRVLLLAAEPSWIIPVVYTVFLIFREFRNEGDARYIAAALPFMLAIFINDVMVDRGFSHSTRLSHYGFLVLIACMSLILRKRFARMEREIEIFRMRKSGKPSLSGDSREKLEKIVEYLRENYRSDIAREGLAGSVGMNPDYLGKIFKEYTGKKISDYINDLRIREAVRLLEQEDVKVIDIAFSVGFDNLSTFYRVFQGIMGESPTSYRDRASGGKK